MVHLAQGDLAGARAAMRADPRRGRARRRWSRSSANYWDLYWVLDDEQQQLLLRLTPGGVRRGPGRRGHRAGRDLLAPGRHRPGAGVGRLGPRRLVKTLAGDAGRSTAHVFLALALAYLGRKARRRSARAERGLTPETANDSYTGTYLQHVQARVYLLAGEPGQGDRPAGGAPGSARTSSPGLAPDRSDVRSASRQSPVQEAGGGGCVVAGCYRSR